MTKNAIKIVDTDLARRFHDDILENVFLKNTMDKIEHTINVCDLKGMACKHFLKVFEKLTKLQTK